MDHLERKLSLLENEMRLLKMTSDVLMERYGEQRKAVGRSMEKLLKSFAARFIGTAMCISRDITKRCLRKISALDYFSEHLCRNLTGCSERSFRSGNDIGGGMFLVSVDAFSLLEVDIYKRSFMS